MRRTLCFAAAAVLAAATPMHAQTAYPLTCVFAAGQTVGISPSLTTPNTELVVAFSFRPATRAATDGVDPGTCAWQDRAFRPGEPTTVMHVVRTGWTYVMLNDVPVLAPTSAPWAPQAATPGYRITFQVYSSPPAFGSAVPFLRVR